MGFFPVFKGERRQNPFPFKGDWEAAILSDSYVSIFVSLAFNFFISIFVSSVFLSREAQEEIEKLIGFWSLQAFPRFVSFFSFSFPVFLCFSVDRVQRDSINTLLVRPSVGPFVSHTCQFILFLVSVLLLNCLTGLKKITTAARSRLFHRTRLRLPCIRPTFLLLLFQFPSVSFSPTFWVLTFVHGEYYTKLVCLSKR